MTHLWGLSQIWNLWKFHWVLKAADDNQNNRSDDGSPFGRIRI
jgi:hypothetical protein